MSKAALKVPLILISFWLGLLPAQQNSLFMAPDTFPLLPALKADFMVNSPGGDYGTEQLEPAIAADSSGNYAVAWIDQRNGRYDIYIQFFNNRDEQQGDNIRVSDQSFESYYALSVAANKSGDFIVAWKNTPVNLMVQKFSNAGVKTGGNIQVNSSGGLVEDGYALTVAGDGSFMISWDGWHYHNGVFATVFGTAGNAVNEVMLNDSSDQGGYYLTDHGAAVDDQGNFVAVWENYNNNNNEIFLQHIDLQGNKVGNNIKITAAADSLSYGSPAVTATADGYFFIIWNYFNYKTTASGTAARIYRSQERVLLEPLLISGNNTDLYSGSLAGNRKDAFWIFNTELYYERFSCQKIGRTGELQGEPLFCNLDSADSLYLRYTRELNIADLVTDHFCLSFKRNRRSDMDIFARKYDLGLLPLNNPVKASLDPGSSWQIKPLVCFNQQGSSIVLWEDQRNGRQDLYAQIFDADYNVVGENIQISDMSGEYWYLTDKKVQALSNGTFVIAFSGTENMTDRNIYLQLVDPGGYKINANQLVKNIYNPDHTFNVELNVDHQDQILICWYNERSANLQKYDQNLADLAAEKILYKNTSAAAYPLVAVSINKDLNVFITRLNPAGQGNALCGLLYDQEGKAISRTLIIERFDYTPYLNTLDNYLTDDGDYIVSWIYNSRLYIWRTYTTDQAYTLRNSFQSSFDYYPLVTDIIHSENHKILIAYSHESEIIAGYLNDNRHQSRFYHLGDNESFDYINGKFCTAAIFNEDLFFSYESNRQGGSGIDIWGNVQSLADIDFDPESFYPPSGDDFLYPNFPNPFNGVTHIHYEILAYHKVKLAVYDVLGREVKVLVDKNQERGFYEVELNAAGLASGIYFVKLEAFRTQVRKIIIIK
jgi:hypothetical protein